MKKSGKSGHGYSEEAKSRLIRESLEPGANVSAIARRENVSPSRLFGWRRKLAVARKRDLAPNTMVSETPRFARVETPRNAGTGMIEALIGQVVLRAGPDVDAEHFARVIRGVLA